MTTYKITYSVDLTLTNKCVAMIESDASATVYVCRKTWPECVAEAHREIAKLNATLTKLIETTPTPETITV